MILFKSSFAGITAIEKINTAQPHSQDNGEFEGNMIFIPNLEFSNIES